jgi:hypothetical protein
MSKNAKLITNDTVTIVLNGNVITGSREVADKIGVTVALQRNDLRKAFDLLNREKSIKRRSAGAFVIENGVVLHNGVPVHNVIADRIVTFLDAGLPFEPLVKFLENLLLNTSARAVAEGYEFLENKNLPVTDDGQFLAYKSVASDYLSKASGVEPVEVSKDGGKTWKTFVGRIPNNVGNLVRMQRNMVDDNREQECSRGLHVGALGYSGPNGWYHSAGDNVIIVKINPRDIVSVPRDHQAQKMRVSQYEVISDFVSAYEFPLTNATGNEFKGSEDSDEPEVFCNEDLGGCGWEGDFPELDDGYICPVCGSEDAIEDLDF